MTPTILQGRAARPQARVYLDTGKPYARLLGVPPPCELGRASSLSGVRPLFGGAVNHD